MAGPHQRNTTALNGRLEALIFFWSLNPLPIAPPLGLDKSMKELDR